MNFGSSKSWLFLSKPLRRNFISESFCLINCLSDINSLLSHYLDVSISSIACKRASCFKISNSNWVVNSRLIISKFPHEETNCSVVNRIFWNSLRNSSKGRQKLGSVSSWFKKFWNLYTWLWDILGLIEICPSSCWAYLSSLKKISLESKELGSLNFSDSSKFSNFAESHKSSESLLPFVSNSYSSCYFGKFSALRFWRNSKLFTLLYWELSFRGTSSFCGDGRTFLYEEKSGKIP